jgi:hypothetical protein
MFKTFMYVCLQCASTCAWIPSHYTIRNIASMVARVIVRGCQRRRDRHIVKHTISKSGSRGIGRGGIETVEGVAEAALRLLR